MLNHILAWDRSALVWINSHHCRFFDAVLVPVSYAGEVAAIWIAICVAMLIFGRAKERKTAVLFLVALVIVDRIFAAGLGEMLPRVRPYLAIEGIRQIGIRWTSGSFPSGHAHSVWLACVIFCSRWPRLILPMAIFSILTCYARPYMGMHYPLDVTVGSLLGLAAGFCVLGLEQLWVSRCRKEPKGEAQND